MPSDLQVITAHDFASRPSVTHRVRYNFGFEGELRAAGPIETLEAIAQMVSGETQVQADLDGVASGDEPTKEKGD